jgi:glycosyltransferase involved in cell wall biosynthesis
MTGNHSLRDRRIALVSNTSWYLWNFRGDTIRALASLGSDVITIAPEEEYRPQLEELGARHVVWEFDRRSTSPLANLGAFLRLRSLYGRLSPDVVHHFTIKPVILGGVAARFARVPGIVQSVPGLGHAFSESNTLHVQALTGYRFALAGRARTIFQNAEDMERLVGSGVASADRSVLVRGSGVDVERLGAVPLPAAAAPGAGSGRPRAVTFLMACRMLWTKGVREFVEAAAVLRGSGVDARFILLGDPDAGNPDAVPREWLASLAETGDVEWRGFHQDITPHLAIADVVVLPSFYGEGVPRSLLEGGAAARALITTDTPGCRDVVADGETGLLVPVRDAQALARAMERLARDLELRRRLGEAARERVRAEFSSARVVEETLAVYVDVLTEERQ